jgi:hypothetical protein
LSGLNRREAVNLAKQMVVGDMPLKAEAVEQRLLYHPTLAHHWPNLRAQFSGAACRPRAKARLWFTLRSRLKRHRRPPLGKHTIDARDADAEPLGDIFAL